LQCVAVCCSVLQCVAVCCSVLQCVAVCCSVLQCVAVCCSEYIHIMQDVSQRITHTHATTNSYGHDIRALFTRVNPTFEYDFLALLYADDVGRGQ